MVNEKKKTKHGPMYGKHHTKEARKKMSITRTGQPKFFSKEHNKKISIALTGKIKTKEQIEKQRKSLTGYKHTEEAKRNMSLAQRGEKGSNWQGGISKQSYPVDWTNTLRRSIRERDHYTCQLCGELQGDRAHAVHHIDYNKKNCNPINLITLCIRCHLKTNYNRELWKKYFEKLK